MRTYAFKTLRGRLSVMLISPVVIILLVAGIWGFVYARNALMRQWSDHVMLQLKQASLEIEIGLSWPLELMKMFSQGGTGEPSASLLESIVQELKTLPGVVGVNISWHGSSGDQRHGNRPAWAGPGRVMRFHRGAFTKISPPVIDESTGRPTVSINMVLMDAYDTPVGTLEIVLLFDALVAEITSDPWWKNATACIADRVTGEMVLTSGRMHDRKRLGETGDALELSVKAAITEKTSGTVWGKGLPPNRIVGFHGLDTFPWALVVFADGKTVLAPIIHFRNVFIIGATILILTIFGIIRFNVDRISSIVKHLSRRAGTIAAGDYKEKMEVNARDELGQLADSFNTMIDGLKERDTIRNTFGVYVNPDFARSLLRRPEAARLGGRRKEVAILMADIRGFTPMTEKMSPEATIDVLNRYFSAVIPLIQKHQGIIVDFVGDGILAFFEPAGELLTVAVKRSVQCAIDMQAAMDLLNQEEKSGVQPPITMGIGINSGPVVVGNIGSEIRKKYGIVGACVNVAQRIQGQSSGGEIVVSESIYAMVKTDVIARRAFPASLKGVASAVQLYAIAAKTNNRTDR